MKDTKVHIGGFDLEVRSFPWMEGAALISHMGGVMGELERYAMVYLSEGGKLLDCQVLCFPDRMELVKVLGTVHKPRIDIEWGAEDENI